jgi:cell wall-associated NlpC family hydrolase
VLLTGRGGSHELMRVATTHGEAEVGEELLVRYVENAVAWALEHVGSTDYALRCLAFVEDAYERSNAIEVFGGDSASASAEEYGARNSTGEAPAGAFVFFDCAGPVAGDVRKWGHVGLALGDGRMVHAWGAVRVDAIAEILDLPGADGWTVPT